MLIYLLVICSVIAASKADLPTTEEYPHSAILDAEEKVKLYWKFDDVYITFELHGNTTGWIGVGISPNGGMNDADMFVGWVVCGTVTITDRHGEENTFPPLDSEQNIETLGGMESDGWTMIKFRRQLASCDPGFDLPITTDTMHIIYAFGTSEPSCGNGPESSHYHGPENRGTKSLILLELSGEDETNFPEGETHNSFEIKNENFEIPAEKSYYNCRIFKLPVFAEKLHLVKIEPVIQPGNERYLHHILVNECSGDLENSPHVNQDTLCYGSNMPPDYYRCAYSMHAWTIGGTAMYYPKHTGYPLGNSDSPRYVMMETHYDNPEALSGIVDSSGLRFTYTNQLREFDAGVITTGTNTNGLFHLIPPNAQSFLSYGECLSDCLEKSMKHSQTEKLNVFGVLLHSHLLGRGLKVRHIRNKVELPYLSKDSSYDFNYQETRKLKEEREILPGDTLQVVCDYNSENRKNMTVGGLATQNEMCVAFVYYYPKTSATFCTTSVDGVDLMKLLGIETVEIISDEGLIYRDINDVRIKAPEELAGQTVADLLNSMPWNEETSKEFEVALRDMGRMQYCIGPQSIPGAEVQLQAPVVEYPYVEELPVCINGTTTTSVMITTARVEDPDSTTTGGVARLCSSLWLFWLLVLSALFFRNT